MKKFLMVFVLAAVLSCSGDSTDRNPFLREVNFSFEVNLNLPLYSSLNTTGNAVYIGNQGVGIRGVFVINTGFGNFLAWEASCPNQAPSGCSTMNIQGGTMAVCPCDDFEYSLFNGQLLTETPGNERRFGLLNYRTRVNDNIVIISN
ncbi:hypothetical protein GWK08_14020 [Leptobacterium flavescens]|uniref:Rieske domain-containing protein n=2 Tax=Leptobacterium flavescens TaxID=472055 RepID=A0A6P0UNL9_9FLAO|nr:hypothetical protein [Leptobacterium flavescens]